MTSVNQPSSLVARDLMTAEVTGISADCTAADAEEWLLEQGFDVAPVIEGGEQVASNSPVVVDGNTVGYIRLQDIQDTSSGTSVTELNRRITMDDLIDPEANFEEILEALFYRHWYFIGFQSGIEGILTRADLNKPLVSTYFYTLIHEFETSLRGFIQEHDIDWEQLLHHEADPPDDYSYKTYLKEAEDYYGDSVAQDLELEKIQYTTLTHLREIVRHRSNISDNLGITADQIHRIKELRNDVAHPKPKNILTLTVDPNERITTEEGHRTIGDLDDIHFDLLTALEELETKDSDEPLDSAGTHRHE